MRGSAGRFGPLPGDCEFDVAVIGAGVTGATTALLLKRSGLRVVVLEAGPVGRGETARSTAHLTQILDTRYHRLTSHVGAATAAVAWEAHGAAIDTLESLARDIPGCAFTRVPGYLFTEHDAGEADLEAERDAIATLGGHAALTRTTPLPFPVAAALRVEKQAQIDPLRYLAGLLAAVDGGGSAVYEGTRAIGLHEGSSCQVDTDRGVVTCQAVVIAAHVPVLNRVLLHAKLLPTRSYVIAIPAPPGMAEDVGLFWDTETPYHYVRACRDGDDVLLLIGGADHRVGDNADTERCFATLEEWAAARFAGPAEKLRVRHRWSGQIIEPADGLPYIGRNALSTKVFVATGFSGNGITGGTLAAGLLAEDVTGGKHPWHDTFAATRVRPFVAARAYVKQNADVARHLIVDRFRTEGLDVMTSLPPGSGCVVQSPAGPLAVYRAEGGRLSACSAVCTHLGCLVSWNTAERSWDCPCHGSRFDPYGEVLNGPATEPLPRRNFIDETAEEAPIGPAGLDPLGV